MKLPSIIFNGKILSQFDDAVQKEWIVTRAPHWPRGCIAQAWSVAEPLRAYVEDVMQIRPKYEEEVLQGLR